LSGLPIHNKIKVKANLHFIDNWSGEIAYLKIDSSVVWLKSVSSSPSSIDFCGGNYKEAAFNVPIVAETLHEESSVVISF
jgi:hypothetical protein